MADGVNKLHLYFGEGKGKTTAAMGLAVRAVGHHWPVAIAQFLKTGRSGELAALAAFPEVSVLETVPVHKFTFRMSSEEKQRLCHEQTVQLDALWDRLCEIMPKLIVLDELAMAMHLNLIDEAAALALIEKAMTLGEVVITGRYAPSTLLKLADYISQVLPVKHPYKTEGLHARQGIEF